MLKCWTMMPVRSRVLVSDHDPAHGPLTLVSAGANARRSLVRKAESFRCREGDVSLNSKRR